MPLPGRPRRIAPHLAIGTDHNQLAREKFAMAYFRNGGVLKKAAEAADISEPTAVKWAQEKAFAVAQRQIEERLNARTEQRITRILDKTFEEIEDRLEHGDEKLLKGELFRVKVPAQGLAVLTGVLFDKREQLRKNAAGEDKEKEEDHLERIAAKLRQFQQLPGHTPPETIDVTPNEEPLANPPPAPAEEDNFEDLE